MTQISSQIDLSGQTALVTGASRGIGRAIAQVLATCGADVIGVGTSIMTRSDELSERFTDLPGRFTPKDCDLSDRSQIDALVHGLDQAGTQIDILINNAGIIRRTPAHEHSTEDWDAVMAINLDAVFLLTRDLGRRMLERGHGKVVNVASLLSFQGGILVPGYAASKGAVAQLTKSFANEWAAHGVNVNAVAPGYIATDNTEALQKDPERTRDLMARVPAGRWGAAEDIAWPVAFLVSPQAAFIHGVVLPVDGGWMGR